MPKTPTNVVPPEVAKQWVDAWRDTPCQERMPHNLKGFLIPMEDLVEVMQEQGVANVRTYLAIANGESKLLIVGVDAQGNDMIDEQKGWYIYDFTRPCPPVCGTGGLSEGHHHPHHHDKP